MHRREFLKLFGAAGVIVSTDLLAAAPRRPNGPAVEEILIQDIPQSMILDLEKVMRFTELVDNNVRRTPIPGSFDIQPGLGMIANEIEVRIGAEEYLRQWMLDSFMTHPEIRVRHAGMGLDRRGVISTAELYYDTLSDPDTVLTSHIVLFPEDLKT